MDFIKTLLIYMTLLSTMAVQEGPLPQDAPTPSAAPPQVTIATYTTEVPTATPSPTPGPVALLPANSRYETLRYQDRGDDVRKLQKKLIELGYMPEGSADGAYGYQTYNAVRDFQRANGLDADGVAGPATLTNLYENKAVLPKTTPAPAVTATPTPTMAPIPTPVPVTPAPATAVPEATIVPPMEAVTEAPAADPFQLTEVANPIIISGNTGKTLTITQVVDGVEVPLQPMLWENAQGEPVMSLRDLVDCYESWSLTGSAAQGQYTLHAAGYEIELMLAGETVRVTVDDRSVTLENEDVRYRNGILYISGNFLTQTLDANVIYDADEHSLVLFIREKSMAEAND